MISTEIKLLTGIFISNIGACIYCINNNKPLYCKYPLQYTIFEKNKNKL